MSWHLRILRRAGIVTTHRAGRQVHCAVNPKVLGANGSLFADFLEATDLPEAEEVPEHQGARGGIRRAEI
jgi:DNA-binding transcriptional ArsR family regulator